MDGQPLFSYTANFLLTLNVSRPNFKAQAQYTATAVGADAALPAALQARAVALTAAIGPFNEKLVSSTQAAAAETFGTARAAARELLNTQLRRLIAVRYGPRSPGYDRFLPQGKEEYNAADEGTYFTLFERYAQAMNAETPAFAYPPTDNSATTPAQDATALLNRLRATRAAVDTYEAKQQQTTTDITADWRAVAVAQWRLWLGLADHFAADPDYRERIYNYFDFSQMRSQGNTPAAEAPAPQP